MGLTINVGKSEVLGVKKDHRGSCEKVRVNGDKMQEGENFKYQEVRMEVWDRKRLTGA